MPKAEIGYLAKMMLDEAWIGTIMREYSTWFLDCQSLHGNSIQQALGRTASNYQEAVQRTLSSSITKDNDKKIRQSSESYILASHQDCTILSTVKVESKFLQSVLASSLIMPQVFIAEACPWLTLLA